MTRQTRLTIGSALILAIGCSTAQRAAESVPLEDRLRAEVVVSHALCIELPDNAAPDLKQFCAFFLDGDGPVSGDSGGKEFPGGEPADVNRGNPERQEAREIREGGANVAPTGAGMPPGKTSGPMPIVEERKAPVGGSGAQ